MSSPTSTLHYVRFSQDLRNLSSQHSTIYFSGRYSIRYLKVDVKLLEHRQSPPKANRGHSCTTQWGESRVNFSKVIKGTREPFKVTIYVEKLGGGDYDCTLTELEFTGKKKIDGLEQNLKLQEPIKYTPESKTASSGTAGKVGEDDEDEEEDDRDFERTFVSREGGVTAGGDDEEEGEEFTVHWEKFVFKQFGNGYDVQEEMAWISLGKKGENVLTTEKWKD